MKKISGIIAALFLGAGIAFAQAAVTINNIDANPSVSFNKTVDGFKNVTVIKGNKVTTPNLAVVDLSKYADCEIEFQFSCQIKVVDSTKNDCAISWMINEPAANFPEIAYAKVKNNEWTKMSGNTLLTLSAKKSMYISGSGLNKQNLTIYIRDFKLELFSDEIGKEKPVQISWKDAPSLNDAYKPYFDYIGFATPLNGVLSNTDVDDGLYHQAGSITMENEFKPDFTFAWQKPSNFKDFTAEDGKTYKVPGNTPVKKDIERCLAFAQFCNVKMRGHVLVWHSQTPDWFFRKDYSSSKNAEFVDAEEMTAREEWYIKTILGYVQDWEDKHNKGERIVTTWDVANETASDGATKTQFLRKDSNWYRVFQNDTFIVNAFRFANKYAPSDVLLALNDYGCSSPAKNAALLKIIDDIQACPDARLDVMGMQTHTGMNAVVTGNNSFETAIQNFTAKGLDVQITEMEIAMDGQRYNSERLKNKYKEFMTMFLNNRKTDEKHGVRGVTFWGIVDERSWIYKNSDSANAHQRPLLFDGNYTCKPAFYGVLEAATEYKE